MNFFKEVSATGRARYRQQTIARYKATHNQRSPYDNNEVIVNKVFEGKQQDIVIMRVTA